MDLTQLCKQIAEIKPDWYVQLPGVAAKDPLMGLRFRWLGGAEGDGCNWIGGRCRDFGFVSEEERQRVLSAGPDYTDPVTVNALLGDGSVIDYISPHGPFWQVRVAKRWKVSYDRTDAILTAYLMHWKDQPVTATATATPPQVEHKNNVVVGGFYRMPDGRIVKTYGGGGEFVRWYTDGPRESGQSTRAEMDEWEYLEGMQDFPNATDPLLPYEFDLNWDVHTLGQFLSEGSDAPGIDNPHVQEICQYHGIDLRNPDTIRAYNDKAYADRQAAKARKEG